MTGHTWTLTVEFGYDNYSENALTEEQEAKEFEKFVLGHWCTDREDLDPDELTVDGATVTIQVDVLDYLTTPIRWITGYTIPKRWEVKRND